MTVERIEMPASPAAVAEWQSEFQDVSDPGQTVAEIAAIVGITTKGMAYRLEQGVREGKYRKGTAYRDFVNGRRKCTVYQIVKPARKRK